jgi:ribosomal protein S18 acetylase RimI-like enzyme
MSHPLDNPVWHALSAPPHAALAIGRGAARHYPRDIAPFSAIAAPDAASYADLAADLPPGAEARLFRPAAEEPAPAGWEMLSARPILQMIADGATLTAPDRAGGNAIVDLGAADIGAMLDLAAATKPGPFDRRTILLGDYVGMWRDDGVLLAMAGERLRLGDAGFVELSAICTRPEARGRGLAASLTHHLARRALARGETPFLHVFPDNQAALALYQRLGFRTRTTLFVLWRRPQRRERP